jgi:hypothetical protein
MHLFQYAVLIFMATSTFFGTEGLSSGRWLHVQVCYCMFHMYRYRQFFPATRLPKPMHVKHAIAYLYVVPSSEDEPSVSKNIEDII